MDTFEKEIHLLPLFVIAPWIIQPVDSQYIIIIIIIITASEFSLGGSSP
jgi:hypothetical protein